MLYHRKNSKMVIRLIDGRKEDGRKTGLKTDTIIQTTVEESTNYGSAMDMETKEWMLETSQNLKLSELAIDCIKKKGEREKKKLALIFEFRCISQNH